MRFVAFNCTKGQAIVGELSLLLEATMNLVRAVILLLPILAWSACAAPTPLVVTHVTVIDATAHAPQLDQTVVIDNGRIVSIGPSARAKWPRKRASLTRTENF